MLNTAYKNIPTRIVLSVSNLLQRKYFKCNRLNLR